MKKSAATNKMVRGQRVPAQSNKNTALKKVGNKKPALEEKKQSAGHDTVILTQSEFDAIIGALGKLSMEKGGYCAVCFVDDDDAKNWR